MSERLRLLCIHLRACQSPESHSAAGLFGSLGRICTPDDEAAKDDQLNNFRTKSDSVHVAKVTHGSVTYQDRYISSLHLPNQKTRKRIHPLVVGFCGQHLRADLGQPKDFAFGRKNGRLWRTKSTDLASWRLGKGAVQLGIWSQNWRHEFGQIDCLRSWNCTLCHSYWWTRSCK